MKQFLWMLTASKEKTQAKQRVKEKEKMAKVKRKARAMVPTALPMTKAKGKERAQKGPKGGKEGKGKEGLASSVVGKVIGVENAQSGHPARFLTPTAPQPHQEQRAEDGEAYDLTYSDEDTDWVIFDEQKKRKVKPSSNTTWIWWGVVFKAVRQMLAQAEDCRVVLDTGADVSVLRMTFADIGVPLSKKERCTGEHHGRWCNAPGNGCAGR